MSNQKQLSSKIVRDIYFEDYADADKALRELVEEKLKGRMKEIVEKGKKPCKKSEKGK